VYVALLRSFHPEGRELIRRALDTLVPVLPARLLPEDLYKVVKWTKKILVDDGYSMPQMCHIWHMIIRFSDVFYSYRSQLVPQMLNAVTRIGLSGNAASEFRLVAVAIADLVITWEIKKPEKAHEFMTGGHPSATYNEEAVAV
jgi:transformation/transcription domain-associated protein